MHPDRLARPLLAAVMLCLCMTPAAGALEYGGEGRGTPRAPFPSQTAIASAASFLQARAGRTSFAVVDDTGELGGLRVARAVPDGERREGDDARRVSADAQRPRTTACDASRQISLLYPMIHISDNEAALGGVRQPSARAPSPAWHGNRV